MSVTRESSGRIIITFPYDPYLVEKVRTIDGRKWHKDKRYRSFPDSDGTLEKILKVFEGEQVNLDPALQSQLHRHVIARGFERSEGTPKQSQKINNLPSPLVAMARRGEGQGEGKFEDLRRELVSRKYSYKTVKGYLYYNRDFLNFISKKPSDINDNDIKDYLLHLAEDKQSATSTLNQAINALKFYYGTMLKKKFLYDIKRPRQG